jgi:hypothetical protein
MSQVTQAMNVEPVRPRGQPTNVDLDEYTGLFAVFFKRDDPTRLA